MRLCWLVGPALALAPVLTHAQSQFLASDGSRVQAMVIECAGAMQTAVPCGGAVPLNFGSLGTYTDGSVQLSTTVATQVFPAASSAIRVRIKLVNQDGVNEIWCRWNGTPAVGGSGSFKLGANGGGIDDNGAGVNQSAVSCIAASGTPNLYAEQY